MRIMDVGLGFAPGESPPYSNKHSGTSKVTVMACGGTEFA
jgi:hypothetical protein